MDESGSKGLYNESSSDDDGDYEETKGNRLLGFMFGNVDNSGDLDADYLDEEAKEHLSALADKLGSSLTDINLLEKSPHMPADPSEQDYDEKDENAVDYEDIDEQYEGPEILAASEEDYLLPKKEYFASEVSLASLKPKTYVFDDEDYDEEEASEKDHVVMEGKSENQDIISDVLEEESTLEYNGQPSNLETENELESIQDVQEEADELLEGLPDDNSSTPLPTLYVEDGTVILKFSEIFAIHKQQEKQEKRDHRYITFKDKYKSMDAFELVEEDEEAFLKNYSSFDSYVNQGDMIQRDISMLNKDGSELVNFGAIQGVAPTTTELAELRMDSCIMGEPLKEDITDDFLSKWQSQLSVEAFPLDQKEWEDNILWDISPAVSDISVESHGFPGPDFEDFLIRSMESESEQQSLHPRNSRKLDQAEHKMFDHDSTIILESLCSRNASPPNHSSFQSRHHPQLLRLESWSNVDDLNKDDVADGNLDLLESDALRLFSNLTLQNRYLVEEPWLDSVIWEPEEPFSKPKLIIDLQDEHMLFEIPDNEDSKHLQLHAGAMVISRSFKSSDGDFLDIEGRKSRSGWQFNISNDKFYMNGKASQPLQSNSNKGSVRGLKVFHSAPALKLQTMKLKLSNKDKANFHRPKALWYPHDNELAIKEQGKLSTQRPMKVVVKSMGGKGSKLQVDAEETVSSVKVKASKKLDFIPTETVKMFYLGKELEDDKSLASQNVRSNSLVHLVRTKVHLWPGAEKLPVENKSLRPPGAFKKKSDLSVTDGHVVLMEYCEERPLLLSNLGMGANLRTYYQKSSPSDQNGNLLGNLNDSLGNVLILEPGDKCPFLGDMRAGCSQSSIETNMYRAPVFPHKVQSTDYLLVRSAKGKLSLRRIDRIAVVGQQEPLVEVMSPGSKNLQTHMVNRMLVYVYHEFSKHGLRHPICAEELSFLFSNLSDAIIRKNMRTCAILKRDRNGKPCWFMRPDVHVPPENELKKMVAPEHVCAYESMQAGLYRLKHLGIRRLTLPTGIASAMTQLPDEAIALAAASHIERELQITPWNLSSNFVACTNQDRTNIERLEITGVGDPSGRGLGFSYVRAAPRAPAFSKKKAAAGRGGTTVTGTDADLRRLSMEAAREVLLKFNVPDELIAKQTRWHRIAMIRKLSSEQAALGVKVDPTTISKYARGQRMSFLQLQQQTREKCQEIWDHQFQSLSAFVGDENESEFEANSDLDSFAGDLENLLDAEGCEEGEEVNFTSEHDKLDGVERLKMRKRPPRVEAEEEFEDEAAEAAELCRLFMDDDKGNQKKKKKKAKAFGLGVGLFPHSRSNIGVQIVDPIKKFEVIAKKPIVNPTDAFFSGNGNVIRDAMNVDSSIRKSAMPGKLKTVKDNGILAVGQPVKVKILGDNLKTNYIKEKKSARENFVCGACGKHGHMRTNKLCPKYGETTESQLENLDMEKSGVKFISPDQSGLSKSKSTKKKPLPKNATKIPLVEAPESNNSSSKTKVLPLKYRYGGLADNQTDKHVSEALGSSDLAAMSYLGTGTKSAYKISEIIVANESKPEEPEVESDRLSHLTLPEGSNRDSGWAESPKPSVSTNTEREQVVSSKLSISVSQPCLSIDRDPAESHRPRLVIRPPASRQKKLVIRRSEEKTDQDWYNLEESPQFVPRKTKRMVELAGLQQQEKNLRSIESSKRKNSKEERIWWGEERMGRDYEDDAILQEQEPENIAGIKRYQEAIRREREEEEIQRAKKKKTKKKQQKLEIGGDYLDDYRTRRNVKRIPATQLSAKRRPVDELGHYGAECAPPTKRRRGGEVDLANILEQIVETLRENTSVSYLFLKPVSKKEAPDYLDIIDEPMDLSTIRDKVRRIGYRDRENFRHDVWQIAYNAHKYNDGRNPGIPPLADQLLELCDYLLDVNHYDLDEAEAIIKKSNS